ncbi:hypothetical protein JW890_08700 [candidate division WOR-3 bacterium]|nr:hypothetical protein [candidate division WOR-3 bacterium]
MRQIICIIFFLATVSNIIAQEIPATDYQHPGSGYYESFLSSALKILRTEKSDVGFSITEPPPLLSNAVRRFMKNPLEIPEFLRQILSEAEKLKNSRLLLSLCRLSAFFDTSFSEPLNSSLSPDRVLIINSYLLAESFGKNGDTLFSLAAGLLRDESSLLDLDPYEEYLYSLDYSSYCSSLTEYALQVNLNAHRKAVFELLEIEDLTFFESESSDCPYADGEITKWKDTGAGPIIIGGYSRNTYNIDRGIILDLGGNDEYRLGANKYSVTMIIDCGGNDAYYAESDFSVAGTFGGVSIVIDSSGNDLYMGSYASIGSSIFGISFLEDISGDDIYIGDVGCLGASACGTALLLDRSGNDRYLSKAYSQGCSGFSGVGFLTDLSGNDNYVCKGVYLDKLRFSQRYLSFGQGFSIGLRPDLPGGIGVIIDGEGNDSYDSDVFSQGCAYWYALGCLYDVSGNDIYTASQYVQGSGVHLAVGIIMDGDGDDIYVSKSVSQGCGHDLSTGMLIDEGGNDIYTGEGLCQGAGNANSWSLFIESAGDDFYTVKIPENSRGWSDTRRGYRGTGLFLDIRGNDSYVGIGSDSTAFLRKDMGLFLDLEDGF